MRRFISSHLLDIGLFFVVLVWGVSPTLFKIALEEVQPLTFVIMRFLLLSVVALVALLLYARRRPAIHLFRIRRADIGPLIVSGLSGYGIYQLFYVEGLYRTTAFAAALFSATVPLWSAVLLALMRVERIGRWQWVGILISLGGVAWFLAARPPSSEAPVDSALTPTSIFIGNVLSLVGAGLFALYGVVNKRLATRYSPPELMAYTLLVGTAALLPFGVASLATQDWSHVTWRLWVILPYSVLFPIYITYSIWNWAIGQKGVGYVTLYNYAVPVLGGIAAFLIIHEALSPIQALAGAVVLGGMLLARWAITHRRGTITQAVAAPSADALARKSAD
ncbi:MAG TPA: DMT family transporter [Ktedonobacterales bacterium]|nr:DMT family transporter [Ktedonobacterales bacterium]